MYPFFIRKFKCNFLYKQRYVGVCV
jgi:hypothetical protein